MTRLLPFALALGLAGAAHADYGKLRWGASVQQVRKALGKRVKVRAADDLGAAGFERRALARVREEDARHAKAQGKQAWRAFRRLKRERPRITAHQYWVEIAGLTARVELHFYTHKLYSVVVRVLYQADQKAAAGQILDLLVEKYGDPEPAANGSDAGPGDRAEVTWDGRAERVVLHKRVVTADAPGLLRISYQGHAVGRMAEGHLAALRKRLDAADAARALRDEAKQSAQDTAAKRKILDHL